MQYKRHNDTADFVSLLERASSVVSISTSVADRVLILNQTMWMQRRWNCHASSGQDHVKEHVTQNREMRYRLIAYNFYRINRNYVLILGVFYKGHFETINKKEKKSNSSSKLPRLHRTLLHVLDQLLDPLWHQQNPLQRHDLHLQ